MKKAAHHRDSSSKVEAVDWWWAVVDDRYGREEVMQMGEVWWRQKQQTRLSELYT